MDWAAVAAWAQVIGALGVVASIFYRAARRRNGNRIAKAAAREALTDSFRNFSQPLAADVNLYRLFNRGVESYETLEGDDRGRFLHLAYQFGIFCESAHYHWAS